MGRKRDLKNFNRKPDLEDLNDLNDWGDHWNQMTTRRRTQNERHKPNRRSPRTVRLEAYVAQSNDNVQLIQGSGMVADPSEIMTIA